ncbi:uncharacterized protein B0H64DRAFT_45640 [Chaetomium fimeti]|uniref:Uncharacterized protein n=1 Tax=Chaetomium fimeti TaxID=1854472 RepID=A0AAE0H7L3_9PEZI|nr:hypothetical protein B0H64DRAFT_45640 [Chaetomium fimeti]
MDGVRSRARSGFRLDTHNRDGITLDNVQVAFQYYESSSQWGQHGADQICVLYFGFDIHERSGKCEIQSADVRLDFSDTVAGVELTNIAPENEIQQTSEREYIERYSLNPSADTPFGGASIGGIERERIFKGLPDWRFRGSLDLPSPTTSATWTWTRGDHYEKARGVPKMEVGVVGRGCVNRPFTGAVTMNLVPRGFWRRVVLKGKEKVFLMHFNPRTVGGSNDLSASLNDFEASIQRKVSARSCRKLSSVSQLGYTDMRKMEAAMRRAQIGTEYGFGTGIQSTNPGWIQGQSPQQNQAETPPSASRVMY